MSASIQIVFSVRIISMQCIYKGHTFTFGKRECHRTLLSLAPKHFPGNARTVSRGTVLLKEGIRSPAIGEQFDCRWLIRHQEPLRYAAWEPAADTVAFCDGACAFFTLDGHFGWHTKSKQSKMMDDKLTEASVGSLWMLNRKWAI